MLDFITVSMERDTGIGPATKLWESFVMPLHQSRIGNYFTCILSAENNIDWQLSGNQAIKTKLVRKKIVCTQIISML